MANITRSTDLCTGGALNVHYASATEDGQYIIAFTVGAAGQSGFAHKIRANFAANTYTLVETLPMIQYASAVGTATVNPVCAVVRTFFFFLKDLLFAYLLISNYSSALMDFSTSR